MTREAFLALLKKYNEGKASPAESDFIRSYYELFDEAFPDHLDQLGMEEQVQLRQAIAQQLLQTILSQKDLTRQRRFSTWQLAASIALVIATIVLFCYRYTGTPIKKEPVQTTPFDIPPGEKKARLILEDGESILLDQQKNGLLVTKNNLHVNKTAEGALAIHSIQETSTAIDPVRKNQLITPTGGQYTVTLPDGSKVWLNAASKLAFPSRFKGSQRIVELDGEAYFDIASDKHKPFIVKTSETAIEVLGTQFNVMAYHDEPTTKTTLITGAVSISHQQSNVRLYPGQQSVVSDNASNIKILTADLQEATAWKDGYFYFKKESLNSIMRKLQRWYGIDVTFHQQVNRNLTFGGMISSDNNISSILNIMELTEKVHFKIEGRRITVMP